MTDSEDENEDEMVDAEEIERGFTILGQKRLAYDLLFYASQIQSSAENVKICDGQSEMIDETIKMIKETADSIWPEEGGVTPLHEIIDD